MLLSSPLTIFSMESSSLGLLEATDVGGEDAGDRFGEDDGTEGPFAATLPKG